MRRRKRIFFHALDDTENVLPRFTGLVFSFSSFSLCFFDRGFFCSNLLIRFLCKTRSLKLLFICLFVYLFTHRVRIPIQRSGSLLYYSPPFLLLSPSLFPFFFFFFFPLSNPVYNIHQKGYSRLSAQHHLPPSFPTPGDVRLNIP